MSRRSIFGIINNGLDLTTDEVTQLKNIDGSTIEVKDWTSLQDLGGLTVTNFVSNAGTSTDNAIARFDSTTGKIVQNSTAIVDDSGHLGLGNGSAANPALFPNADTDCGLFFSGTHDVSVTTQGAACATFNSTHIDAFQPLRVSNGTAGAPGLTFTTDTDTGLYLSGAGVLNFSVASTDVANYTSTLFSLGVPLTTGQNITSTGTVSASSLVGTGLTLGDGSAAAPSFSYSSDSTTGFYRAGSGSIGISSAGSSIGTMSATAFALTKPLRVSTHGYLSISMTGTFDGSTSFTPGTDVLFLDTTGGTNSWKTAPTVHVNTGSGMSWNQSTGVLSGFVQSSKYKIDVTWSFRNNATGGDLRYAIIMGTPSTYVARYKTDTNAQAVSNTCSNVYLHSSATTTVQIKGQILSTSASSVTFSSTEGFAVNIAVYELP